MINYALDVQPAANRLSGIVQTGGQTGLVSEALPASLVAI